MSPISDDDSSSQGKSAVGNNPSTESEGDDGSVIGWADHPTFQDSPTDVDATIIDKGDADDGVLVGNPHSNAGVMSLEGDTTRTKQGRNKTFT